MRTLRQFSLLFLALPVLASATEFQVHPTAPTDTDPVTLTISGTWRDGCIPELEALSIDPLSSGGLTIEVLVATPGDVGCISAITPFEVVAELGILPAGRHDLVVTLEDRGVAAPPVEWWREELEVGPGPGNAAEISFFPRRPTDAHESRLQISGIWRDGCPPEVVSLSFTRDPSTLELFIEVLLATPVEVGCVAAALPYATEVPLGQLPSGPHFIEVRMEDRRVGAPPVVWWARSLDVALAGTGPHEAPLHGGRFVVRAEWTRPDGTSGLARPAELSGASTVLSFFSPENWELLVKVLPGCGLNDHWWVLAAGSTNLAFRLEIEDRQTGERWRLENAAGELAGTVIDQRALPCAPGE